MEYLGVFIFLVILMKIVPNILRGYNEQGKKLEVIENSKMLTIPHLPVLAKKQIQLTVKDDYGNIIVDKFIKEIEYFCEKTLGVTSSNDAYLEVKNNVINATFDFIKDHPELLTNENEFKEVTTPIEYEQYCLKLFEKHGWKANLTKTTGDQGVNIFAKRDGILVAAQCKFYNSPVGNKAVQEVFSAQRHTGANFAAVITNNTYTQSARELASTTGVFLLHHSDIENLFSRLDQIKDF